MLDLFMQPQFVWWGLGLVMGFATLTVLLGEITTHLKRQNNPLAQSLFWLRHLTLPLLVILLFMQQLLDLTEADQIVRLVETLFAGTVIYTGLLLIRNLLQLGEQTPESWVNKMPRLLLTLGRTLLIVAVVYYTISNVWQVDVSQYFTIVGVGALAISFALQDTLNNLASGVLLLLDQPFKKGDRVVIKGELLKVIEINWRSTRLQRGNRGGIYIIPNAVLGKTTIENYGNWNDGDSCRHDEPLIFTHDTPPNKVKRVLLDMLRNVDGIANKPTPKVFVIGYEPEGIRYTLRFWTIGWTWPRILDNVRTQIHYVAKRHRLTIPDPHLVLDKIPTLPVQVDDEPQFELGDVLQASPLFHHLDADSLAYLSADAQIHTYGVGEQIARQGEANSGVHVIQHGEVSLSIIDSAGQRQEVIRLTDGEMFGWLDIHKDVSSITATVVTDATIVTLETSNFEALINRDKRLQLTLDSLSEDHKRMVGIVAGTADYNFAREIGSQNDWLVDLVKRL